MKGTYVTTNTDRIVIIKDKILNDRGNASITKYVCKVIKHLNGDESEYGKSIVISPYDIVAFFNSNEL